MSMIETIRTTRVALARRFAPAMGHAGERPVIAGYTGRMISPAARLALLAMLGLFVLIYGAAVTFLGEALPMVLAAPLPILLGLVIWALPDMKSAPVRWLSILLFAFIVALLAWPDYIALALPGMPWITALRLVVTPLAAITLICLSISRTFRAELAERLSATPLTWKMLAAFMLLAGLSIVVSGNPGFSANKFIVAQLNYTLIFFVSAWVFVKPGRVEVLAWMLWGFVIYVCLIGLLEWRMQGLPWAGRIPSFLAVEDPTVQRILSAKSRASTGIYRVQSKFTTPLGLAEFLAYTTPVVLYFVVLGRNWAIRGAALLTLPLMLHTITRTDSRLGFVGFSLAILLYGLGWSVMQWKNRRGSVFGPAITLAYPALLIAAFASTFLVGRISNRVWGTGAQSYSSMAREEQVEMGLPMVLSQPWGRGLGRGGEVLGFTNPAGVMTIDTYWLAIALEVGVLGFVFYYGIFVAQSIYGAKAILHARTREEKFLVPLVIVMIQFLIIKAIFSQMENHPLVFALLGVMTALIYRIRKGRDELTA